MSRPILQDLSTNGALWKRYKEVEKSVVCIRNRSFYKVLSYNSKGEAVELVQNSVSHSTAVVIDSYRRGRNIEYLLLTSAHGVVSPVLSKDKGLFHQNPLVCPVDEYHPARFAASRFTIVKNSDDETLDHDKLKLLGVDEDRDAALLCTVGRVQELAVHPYGIKNHVGRGDFVITSGFPDSMHLRTAMGAITGINLPDYNGFQPLFVHNMDIEIDEGQSGSPVVRVEQSPDGFVFPIVGLVYAFRMNNTTRLMVPTSQFRRLLETRESVPSSVPSLDETISYEDLHVLTKGPRHYDIFDHQYTILNSKGFALQIYPKRKGYLVNHSVTLSINDEMKVDKVLYINGNGKATELSLRKPEITYTVHRILNHCKHQQACAQLGGGDSPSNLTRKAAYYRHLLDDQREDLRTDIQRMFTVLFLKKIIGPGFWQANTQHL